MPRPSAILALLLCAAPLFAGDPASPRKEDSSSRSDPAESARPQVYKGHSVTEELADDDMDLNVKKPDGGLGTAAHEEAEAQVKVIAPVREEAPKPYARKPQPEAGAGGRPVAQAPAFAPTPQDPQAARQQRQVERLLDAGRSEEAALVLQRALETHPEDTRLQALAKLTPRHVDHVDGGSLLKKMGSLLPGRGAGEAAPDAAGGGAAILASPLSVTAAAGPPSAARDSVPVLLRGVLPQATFTKMRMRDYAGAEADLTAALERHPDSFTLFRLRALTRRFLKKDAEADQDADRALALNPRDGGSHGVKALVRLDRKDAAGARDEAAKALAINPRDADAWVTHGMALQQLGQADQALAELKQAAELEPQFESLYRSALYDRAAPARQSRTRALSLGAVGLAVVFLGLSLLGRRAATARRQAPPVIRGRDEPPSIGGYKILKRIGQGGMGVVFEALDETLQRKVALKQMRAEIAGDPRERRRFLKEARLVASLRHPNIVEIFSVVEQEEELFLVFEYLPGRALNEVLRGGRLTPDQALALGGQMASALDFAHAQGVVHQDLKPANVLVGAQQAKVMDFGIARRVQETLSTLSRSEAAGTPAYMAPEQELGRFQKESDIYALGACLYELLGGTPPYGMGGVSAFVKAERRYPPLSFAAGLPQAVDAVIASALDPDPAGRPASASAFLRALEQAVKTAA